MASLESSQWLHELCGEQKCLKKFPTSGNMSICIENYFVFLQALSGPFPTYSTTIFFMDLSWTSWLESFTAEINRSSPSQVIWGCWLESFGQGVVWPGLLTRVIWPGSYLAGAVDSSQVIFRMTRLVTTMVISHLYVFTPSENCISSIFPSEKGQLFNYIWRQSLGTGCDNSWFLAVPHWHFSDYCITWVAWFCQSALHLYITNLVCHLGPAFQTPPKEGNLNIDTQTDPLTIYRTR
jgi:hypothetical protein